MENAIEQLKRLKEMQRIRRARYYQAHKNDPEWKSNLSELKKRHYQLNRDAIKNKALNRYYTKKAAALAAKQSTIPAPIEA